MLVGCLIGTSHGNRPLFKKHRKLLTGEGIEIVLITGANVYERSFAFLTRMSHTSSDCAGSIMLLRSTGNLSN